MADPEQPQHREPKGGAAHQPPPSPREDPPGAPPDAPSGAPPIASAPVTDAPDTERATAAPREPSEESTIGTGSAIALGCVLGTIVLILVGLAFLLITLVFT